MYASVCSDTLLWSVACDWWFIGKRRNLLEACHESVFIYLYSNVVLYDAEFSNIKKNTVFPDSVSMNVHGNIVKFSDILMILFSEIQKQGSSYRQVFIETRLLCFEDAEAWQVKLGGWFSIISKPFLIESRCNTIIILKALGYLLVISTVCEMNVGLLLSDAPKPRSSQSLIR